MLACNSPNFLFDPACLAPLHVVFRQSTAAVLTTPVAKGLLPALRLQGAVPGVWFKLQHLVPMKPCVTTPDGR